MTQRVRIYLKSGNVVEFEAQRFVWRENLARTEVQYEVTYAPGSPQLIKLDFDSMEAVTVQPVGEDIEAEQREAMERLGKAVG